MKFRTDVLSPVLTSTANRLRQVTGGAADPPLVRNRRQSVQCAIDAIQASLSSEEGQAVEHSRSGRLSGRGDAESVDDASHSDVLRLHPVMEQSIESIRLEVLLLSEHIPKFPEQRRRVVRFDQPLLEGLFVILQLVIRDEVFVVGQDITQQLQSVSECIDQPSDKLTRRVVDLCWDAPRSDQERKTAVDFLLRTQLTDPMLLIGQQLVRIQSGGSLDDAIECEVLDDE